MNLGGIDWLIIAVYMTLSLWVGLLFARRGTESVTEYFVAGRKLTWWLAGTSLVATSFAADTPLAIARIVRVSGFQGNWYWWCGVAGFLFCMFFFAPLWQRSRLLTDVELIDLRYAGGPARALRIALALHKSILVNGITMGWVLLGMGKIAEETFGWPKEVSLPILMVVALVYTAASGLWGVVATDFLQFALAMLGSILLMVLVLVRTGGPSRLAEQVQAAAAAQGGTSATASPDELLSFAPDLSSGGLALGTFFFFILVQWWGGIEGGGFLAQRLFATRSERHAVLALLWFTVAHFSLRSWPWIVVGLASLIYFPHLADPEAAYPKMMIAFLPTGLKGLMVASLLAAFMSTISTHLNWGASYLVNDLYLLRPSGARDERRMVRFSQICSLFMTLLAGFAAWNMTSIYGAWLFVGEISAGVILLGALRWYWWRVNPWAEIAALATSLLVSNGLRLLGPAADALEAFPSAAAFLRRYELLGTDAWYPARFLLVLGTSTLVGLAVLFATKPVPLDHLASFYRRVRPAGAWGPVARICPEVSPLRVGWKEIGAWLLGTAAVYLSIFSLGWFLFGRYLAGLAALAGTAVTGGLLLRFLRNKDWGPEEGGS